MAELSIRKARREDAAQILHFIQALAAYERLSHAVTATVSELEKSLFERQDAFVLIGEADGQAAGFALYFYNYSTFLAKPGLYLEDLFVLPEYRQLGLGKILFNTLKEKARTEGCGRMEWAVLDWNTQARDFYTAQGASAMEDWTVHRIEF